MTLPALTHLQTLLADRYALDRELRTTISECGRTPELLRQQAAVRADLIRVREEIEQATSGRPALRIVTQGRAA